MSGTYRLLRGKTIQVLVMRKWRTYITEALPLAIAVIFLVVIAVNPDTSHPKMGSSFGHLIKEYFLQDPLTQQNIPNLLEQLLRLPLKESTDDNSPLPVLPANLTNPPLRTRVKTTVHLKINNLDGSRIEKRNLRAQVAAMREHRFEEKVYYKMIEE